MSPQQENGSDLDPIPIVVETHEAEGEELGTLGCAVPIEEGVEKISLVGASLSVQGNGGNNDSESQNETESDSENENSESECSSSASDSSSGSSSSDSEDDEEARHDGDVEVEEGEISGSDEEKMDSWSMADDDNIEDDYEDDAGGPIRSTNELQNLPHVPPVDAALEPHHQMQPVGIVTSIIGAQVIVEGVEKHDPLNEGSILWLTESRKPLGLVDEIFGPVKNPFYVVRYNSESEIPVGIHGGTLISFVPEFADHVLSNNNDLYKKGYDASGAYDEELSDEVEFSDDDKETEYKRMQRTIKRGANDQNQGKKNNNRKKFPPKEHVTPTISDAPAAPLLGHGYCAPFSGIGQGILGGTYTVPSFPPINTAPNFTTNGVWTNGTILPQQPQTALLPNRFPTNGISWYPQNTQISAQLPMPGISFQQQLHPSQGPFSTPMLPAVQPNTFAQPMFPPGLVGQNQMTFGLSSPFPPIQPPICAAQQGFPPIELHSERNLNLHSNAISGAPPQFHPGSSANRGRTTFHGAGRKWWRPAK